MSPPFYYFFYYFSNFCFLDFMNLAAAPQLPERGGGFCLGEAALERPPAVNPALIAGSLNREPLSFLVLYHQAGFPGRNGG